MLERQAQDRSYEKIADTTCGATTIRDRRDEWIRLGVFAEPERLVLDGYDRLIGLDLREVSLDGCLTKAPGGGELADALRWTAASRA